MVFLHGLCTVKCAGPRQEPENLAHMGPGMISITGTVPFDGEQRCDQEKRPWAAPLVFFRELVGVETSIPITV